MEKKHGREEEKKEMPGSFVLIAAEDMERANEAQQGHFEAELGEAAV